MVSRERLLHLGATVGERATTRRVRAIGQVLLFAAIVFVSFRVRSLWHGSHIELARIAWLPLIASVAFAAAGTAAGAAIWLVILDGLGLRPQRWWSGIFFQAQLSKYIPGSVWQYAGRAALARSRGIPVRPVVVSLPVEFAASGIAGCVSAGFLLGWWGVLAAALAAVILIALYSPVRSRSAVLSTDIRATLLYIPAWLLLGLSFWLCARGLLGVPARDLALYIGAFAVAWIAGLLAIYAPGGLGVREAVLVALLSGRLGAADALVVAAASRLILLLVDVVFAAAAAVALRRRRSGIDAADPA